MREWLLLVGARLRELRGDEKQEVFAKRIGVSRALLIIMEKGKRSYGIEPLLLALSGATKDPVRVLADFDLQVSNALHIELHRKLQELLDAREPYPIVAETMIDAAYGKLSKKKS